MRAGIAHNNFRPRHAKTSRTIFKVSSDPRREIYAEIWACSSSHAVNAKHQCLTRAQRGNADRKRKKKKKERKKEKKAFRAWILKRPARFAVFRENDDVTAPLSSNSLSLSLFLSVSVF